MKTFQSKVAVYAVISALVAASCDPDDPKGGGDGDGDGGLGGTAGDGDGDGDTPGDGDAPGDGDTPGDGDGDGDTPGDGDMGGVPGDGDGTGGLGGTPGGDGDGDELGDPEYLHFEFERVSVSSDEVQGNAQSWEPGISANGRFVVFLSEATNLSETTSGATSALFLRDLVNGTTQLMSVNDEGTPIEQRPGFPIISGDGQTLGFVAGSLGNTFQPFADLHLVNRTDVFARGLVDPNSLSSVPEIRDPSFSFDGTRLTFSTGITDIVANDTNLRDDVFVYDVEDQSYMLVSVQAEGESGNANSVTPRISADGRFVVFQSGASDLVEGDTNTKRDIFIRELATGKTELVSVSSDGSQADDDSYLPVVSADGRFVAFESWARNLVEGDTNGIIDIYVRDREQGTTTRVSVSNSGEEPQNYAASSPSISGDGRYIVFSSGALTLVEGDTNSNVDVFLYDQLYSKLVSVTPSVIPITLNSSESRDPHISLDGRHVAFISMSQFLVEDDDNGVYDVYVAHLGE